MADTTPRKFTWPPAPLEDGPVVVDIAPGTPGTPGTPAETPEAHPGGHPRNVDRPPPPPPPPPVARVRSTGFWGSLETALLGGGGGVDLDGWAPDPVGRICPRCGGPAGRGEADDSGCAACRGKRLAWNHAVRLGVYDGDLRRAIMACKYRQDRRAGRVLAGLLAERVADRLRESGVGSASVMVVPVPTTTRRRLANGGLDHTMILADGVGRALGTRPVRLLERRHTPHQAGLSAAARAKNVAGTIRVRGGLPPAKPGHVVLVDDVRTTGATASACFGVIRSCFGGRAGEDTPCFWLATAAVSTRRRGAAGTEGLRSAAVGGELTENHKNGALSG